MQVSADHLTRARGAYDRYGAAVKYLNFRGEPMPFFDQLPEPIVLAWVAAATGPQAPGPGLIIGPVMAAASRFGPPSELAWCWHFVEITLPDRVPTGQHGELWAITESEALDRLREALPLIKAVQLRPILPPTQPRPDESRD